MLFDEFLDRLENAHPSGNGYDARCPAHEDRTASLSVTEDGEKILVHCKAGCDTKDVLEHMGLSFSDLFYEQRGGEPEAEYVYEDATGREAFVVVRFPGKRFKQKHRDEGHPDADDDGYVWRMDGIQRYIYRLPQVVAGIAAGHTVYIVEGEKDVASLEALGVLATCPPGGAGKWKDDYTPYFQGANVIIVRDRDEPGRNHAQRIKDALHGVAAQTWIMQAKTGKDITDHLEAGHELSELTVVRERVRRGLITAAELADQAIEDLELRSHDVPGHRPFPQTAAQPLVFRQGRMYALGGYTSDGKSSLALQAAREFASQGVNVGYFSNEMSGRDLRNKLLAHKGLPLLALENLGTIRASESMDAQYRAAVDEIRQLPLDITFDSAISADTIVETATDRENECVIIDHIHRFGWGNDRRTFEREIQKLTNLALEQNVMLIMLCQLRRYSRGPGMESYPRPTLQDFRETEMIGQDAAMALAVWRQRDDSGLHFTGSTQLIILKNRHTTSETDAAGKEFFVNYDRNREMLV